MTLHNSRDFLQISCILVILILNVSYKWIYNVTNRIDTVSVTVNCN